MCTLVKTHCTKAEHGKAVMVCQIMTHVLATSDFLSLCSDLCGCKLAEVLDYDIQEYAICEHRRLVCRPKKRKSKKPLKSGRFCTSHLAQILKIRQAMAKNLRAKYSCKSRCTR